MSTQVGTAPDATDTIAGVKERIIRLLLNAERQNMPELIEWLEQQGFFESPASTRFHGAYRGGLAQHSLRVFEIMARFHSEYRWLDSAIAVGQKPYETTADNLIIAPLLHDVCKVGAYLGDEAPYQWNKATPRGHAELSIQRITKFIALDPIERLMIKFHMGPYGAYEFYEYGSWDSKANAEYWLRSHKKKGARKPETKEERERDKAARYGKSLRNAYYHNPICKFMYFADEMAKAEATGSE